MDPDGELTMSVGYWIVVEKSLNDILVLLTVHEQDRALKMVGPEVAGTAGKNGVAGTKCLEKNFTSHVGLRGSGLSPMRRDPESSQALTFHVAQSESDHDGEGW